MKLSSHMNRLTPHALRVCVRLLLFAVLLCSAAHAALAQDDDDSDAPQEQQTAAPRPPGQEGLNLFALLSLTPEQVGRIREIRRTSEPEGRALILRTNRARRALNEAIYSDEADEALVHERARELAEAQAAATRLRTQVEWRIRNVLTPEQLRKLRDLRVEAQRERRRERLRNPGVQRRPDANALDNTPPRRPNADAANPARPLQRLRRRGVIP